jgi:phospholipid transport system substrate-binding protein
MKLKVRAAGGLKIIQWPSSNVCILRVMMTKRVQVVQSAAGRRQWLAAVCLLLASLPARAAANDDAVAVVSGLQEALVQVASIEPALSLEQRYERLAPVIVEAHDLRLMGRLTVRRFWRDWSDAQRAAFVDAFERLSITTYASRFATIQPDTFEILGSKPSGEDRVEVEAVIHRRDDEDVSMVYLLQSDGERWRIINVFADGASELSVMASEYFDILESGGYDDLIAEIESQIDAMREKGV